MLKLKMFEVKRGVIFLPHGVNNEEESNVSFRKGVNFLHLK